MNKGDFVRINYIGRLESGEVFDLTDEEAAKKENIYSPKIKYGPITIIVGAGFVIPGLEKAITEMGVGEKKTLMIESKDAFGERDPRLVRTVPQKVFKDQNIEPKQGMIVDFSNAKGRVQSVAGGRVRVDFNNPLSGKNLKYDLEIVEKIENPEEQIKGVFEFFGFYNAGVRLDGEEATITNANLPHELKQRISSIVLEYVKGLNKMTYQESFEKKKEQQSN